MASPLLSVIVPTLNRAERHQDAYNVFASQDYEPREMLVLDESKTPSPFFSQLQDARVRYWHEPMERGDVTKIGTTRNKLVQRAVGPLIGHLDDDDWLAHNWFSTLIKRLGDSDIVKLAVWRILVESDGTVWQWDTRQTTGTHYAVRGGEPIEQVEIAPDDVEPQYAEAYRLGFGFSLAYKRDLAMKIPFPAEGTEDYPWVRECLDAGAQLVEVDDFAHGCLHTAHTKSSSMLFPQTPLGKLAGFAGVPRDMRSFVRWRMLGALPSMYELARKGKDFTTQPGVTYSLVAKVKRNHTVKDLTVRAESWGLNISAAYDDVNGADFGVKNDDKDYRLIHIVGTSNEPVRVPWATNKLIAAFDRSCILKVWQDIPIEGADQLSPQLTPAPGVAGFLGRVRRVGAGSLHGFGGGRCQMCVNYAWEPSMGPSRRARDGSAHHPACGALGHLLLTV